MYGYILVYAIEATVHAPSWEGVYGEILKVLKPGGVVSSHSLPWCRTEEADFGFSLVFMSGV
jgi:sterol 24-C-methyltransferase